MWCSPALEMCRPSRPARLRGFCKKHVPGIKVRVINVVDLMTLMFPDKHAHGMTKCRSTSCLPRRPR